jgi:hypothetical protein
MSENHNRQAAPTHFDIAVEQISLGHVNVSTQSFMDELQDACRQCRLSDSADRGHCPHALSLLEHNPVELLNVQLIRSRAQRDIKREACISLSSGALERCQASTRTATVQNLHDHLCHEILHSSRHFMTVECLNFPHCVGL